MFRIYLILLIFFLTSCSSFQEAGKVLRNEKITTNDDLIFESNEFEYDKTKLELILRDNVIITDSKRNIIIKTNEIKMQPDRLIVRESSAKNNRSISIICH